MPVLASVSAPLALRKVGWDPQDELKGYAFKALWPGLISAEELFNHLTFPKKPNFIGSYSYFIRYELSPHLDKKSLPFALNWLKTYTAQRGPRHHFNFENLADDIVILAWKHIDDPDVFQKLTETCIELFKQYYDLVQDQKK
jgi:hypothetical protein